jgi:hypothetical protein
MFVLQPPRYIPCPECNACVPNEETDEHVCDQERWLDYQLVKLRPDIARFEVDFREWLKTPAGQFELFVAEKTRAETSVTSSRWGLTIPHRKAPLATW